MNTTIVLVLLLVSCFVVGHLVQRYTANLAILSGAEYVLIGLVLGSQFGPTLLSQELVGSLSPLRDLLLGLLGFMAGLGIREVMAAPRAVRSVLFLGVPLIATTAMAFVLLSTAVGFQGTSSAQWGALQFWFEIDGPVHRASIPFDALWVSLGLGATAVTASSYVASTVIARLQAQGTLSSFLVPCCRGLEIFGILLFGLTMTAARATGPSPSMDLQIWEWLGFSVAFGTLCGILFRLFIGHEENTGRFYLATVGSVTFASGIGAVIGVSPLFINLIAAITLTTVSPHAPLLRRAMDELRMPIFVLLYVIAGSMWRSVSIEALVFLCVYIAMRIFIHRFFSRKVLASALARVPPAPSLGFGFLAQDAIAVGMGLSLADRFPDWSAVIMTTTFGSVLINAFLAQRGTRTLLADVCEIPAIEGSRA